MHAYVRMNDNGLCRQIKMAVHVREDSKLDIDKDSDIASELLIYNVELTNKILDMGSLGSFVEASWYGGLCTCVAKQVHSKNLESSHFEDFIRSFSHECVTWAKLKHPHIVPLLGLFQTELSTLPLLVMERMDTSLTTLLEDCKAGDKQLSLPQKVSILLQVSSGLAYLHQHDPPAVHGDLSANNVLITLPALTAKISDFGIARSLQLASQNFPTHTSQLYSPPEVLEPTLEESLTAEVDTFTYGVLIVHVINLKLMRLLPSRMKQQLTKELVLVNEFQRRKNDLDLFPERERSLFVDLIEKCLEFSPEDRPNSLALVSNLQEIQNEVGPPQPDDVTAIPKVSNEHWSDSHPIQSPTGLDEVELQILEKTLQLEKCTGEAEAKEEILKQTDENIEEMTKTIQEKNQLKTENEKQLKKVLKFNDIKWEVQCYTKCNIDNPINMKLTLSSNAVECNGDVFIGIQSSSSYDSIYIVTADHEKKNVWNSCEQVTHILQCAHTDGQTVYHSLQDYALVVSQGLLHMLGGEYVSNNQPTGEYSCKIVTLTGKTTYQYQWNECYPPMKTASASPAVVNYKEHIVVVHNSGAVEVLNTNSPSPAWKEVHPAPYIPTTPSATLLGNLLVIWSGTLYYTDLRDMFTDDTEDSNLTADWITLPSLPITSPSACLTTLNDQLIAISAGNTSGRRPLYSFNNATGKWNNIHNQCPGDVSVCVDSRTLLTFCNASAARLSVYKGVLAKP